MYISPKPFFLTPSSRLSEDMFRPTDSDKERGEGGLIK